MPSRKKLIEQAYQMGEKLGLPVWTTDQAGPFPTVPYPGLAGQARGTPSASRMSTSEWHNQVVNLVRPANGQLRTKGVTSCTNVVLHGWL